MLRHALAANDEQGRGSLRRCRGGQLGATKRKCAHVQTHTLFVARSGFSLHCTAAHFSEAHVQEYVLSRYGREGRRTRSGRGPWSGRAHAPSANGSGRPPLRVWLVKSWKTNLQLASQTWLCSSLYCELNTGGQC